ERLILVTTDREGWSGPDDRYVMVDWGPEFHAQHNAHFPDFDGPALSANIGWLGLQHILAAGGSGYFPERLVRPQLSEGRLTKCDGAPDYTLHAYVAWAAAGDRELMAFV